MIRIEIFYFISASDVGSYNKVDGAGGGQEEP
jgi:hypothetical protein